MNKQIFKASLLNFNKLNFILQISLLFLLQSCYVTRAYKYRKFELKDVDNLESVSLSPSQNPFGFSYKLDSQQNLNKFLDSSLQNTSTHSFLVIKNDSIVYEKYFNNVTANTKQPSFSVAKSFVGTLMQMAVQDGYIKSLQEPITNYLGYLKNNDTRFEIITIQNLMDMASGIKSSENYSNPFSDVLHLGFTKNLNRQIKKLKVKTPPRVFDYKSVNTQLLAAIIEVGTQQKLQNYFIKKIWHPLGMQNEASWNIDSKKNQTPRAFCCINATTKDFAKLGKLYLNNGNYNGKQLLNENFIANTINPDSMQKNGGYKNQWWGFQPIIYFNDSLKAIECVASIPKTSYLQSMLIKDIKYFLVKNHLAPYFAEGILDQFIYVNPRSNTIIVRLGHNWNHKEYSCLDFIHKANSILK